MFISLPTKGKVSSIRDAEKFNEMIKNLPALEYIRQRKSSLIEWRLIYHPSDREGG